MGKQLEQCEIMQLTEVGKLQWRWRLVYEASLDVLD